MYLHSGFNYLREGRGVMLYGCGDSNDSGKRWNLGFVEQKKHVVTRRTDFRPVRSGDFQLSLIHTELEKIDSLVLIERVRHRRQPNPAYKSDFLRMGCVDSAEFAAK